MNVVDQDSFRALLQNELARRCDLNTRYSIRAFARYLDVDYSTLSKILRGKVKVADRLAQRLCLRLSVPSETYLRLPKNPAAEEARYLELDIEALAKWYGYALLELTRTKGFRSDERWVAKKLGLAIHQVRQTRLQLERLGLLEVDKLGRWRDVSGSATTTYRPRATSRALRAMQRELLELSREKLETIDINLRDQSSLILRFAQADLDEARAFITEFRREFDRRFGARATADSVYALSLSLFPLTIPEGVST